MINHLREKGYKIEYCQKNQKYLLKNMGHNSPRVYSIRWTIYGQPF